MLKKKKRLDRAKAVATAHFVLLCIHLHVTNQQNIDFKKWLLREKLRYKTPVNTHSAWKYLIFKETFKQLRQLYTESSVYMHKNVFKFKKY